jgi:hypothetical protein
MPHLGDHATTRVDRSAQPQALGDSPEPLPACREEPAQEAAFGQLLQPRFPGLGGRADALEDIAITENPPTAIVKMPESSCNRSIYRQLF